MSLNVLSLFSGIGGLELGLERAGMHTVGQVELDPYCQRVLAKHWPEVPKHDDVRTAPAWWAEQPRPRVDLVAGGFPCQGHSVAGRQRGTADERWGWPWFRGVIDGVTEQQGEAPLVLIENVPNLVRTGLLDVLGDLADRGFDAWWGRVPAAAVGAPHLRWRLFVIAAHASSVDGGARWTWRPTRGGHDGADLAAARVVNPWDGAEWAVADAVREGSPLRPVRGPGENSQSAGRGDALGDRSEAGARLGDWPAEPGVGRVAHGVPARVDRLRALGNAVVPQVAEYVGRLILAGALPTSRAVAS